MLGYKLLTKYALGVLLVASISTYAAEAGGAPNTNTKNILVIAQAVSISD